MSAQRTSELLLGVRAAGARVRLVARWIVELLRYGAPAWTGDPAGGVVVLIDGVGGFKISPVMLRRGLRMAGVQLATFYFDWHRGPRGEMLADLTCLRANRLQGLKLARILRGLRRRYPEAPLHVVSISGGTAIATFAAEKLGPRARIDTLVLAAPAISPAYDFTMALRHVRRCVAFTSRRDRIMLGFFTWIFGTMDRKHSACGGMSGFTWRPLADRPEAVAPTAGAIGTFQQVPWTPTMSAYGNHGHHVGVLEPAFIAEFIAPLLQPGTGRLDASRAGDTLPTRDVRATSSIG